MSSQSIHVSRFIAAAPSSVHRAFSGEVDLSLWLCNGVAAPRRISGPQLLWWADGAYAISQSLLDEGDYGIRFSWKTDRIEDSQVSVVLRPESSGTSVELTHTVVRCDDAGALDALTDFWNDALENLASVWALTGEDLRLTRRPAIGLFPGDATTGPDGSLPDGVSGVRISDILDGSSAQAQGMQAGDIVVELAGVAIDAVQAFGVAMSGKVAGDVVSLRFYRDGEEHTEEMPLLPRPPLEAPPADANEFAGQMESFYAECEASIRGDLNGLPDDQSMTPPAPGRWSANEILAHLILMERLTHDYISHCRLSYYETHMPQIAVLEERIPALLQAVPTRSGLLDALRSAFRETVVLLATLPDEFVRSPVYIAMGQGLNLDKAHYRRHVDQIRRAVEAITSGNGQMPEEESS